MDSAALGYEPGTPLTVLSGVRDGICVAATLAVVGQGVREAYARATSASAAGRAPKAAGPWRGLAEGVFVLTATASIAMVLLVGCEILHVLHPTSRQTLWHVLLWSLTLDLVFVAPLLATAAAIAGAGQPWDAFLAVSLATAYWATFYHLGRLLPLTSAAASGARLPLLERAVARLGVFGVTAMASVSGFAAVQLPLRFLPAARPATAAALEMCEQRLTQTEDLLDTKKRALCAEEVDAAAPPPPAAGDRGSVDSDSDDDPDPDGGWLGTVASAVKAVRRNTGGGAAARGGRRRLARSASAMEADVHMLEELAAEQRKELGEMRDEIRRARDAQTPQGKAMQALGGVLAATTALRALNAAYQVAFYRHEASSTQLDPATYLLTASLRWVGLSAARVENLAHVGSFLVVGVLMWLQVRACGVALALLRRWPHSPPPARLTQARGFLQAVDLAHAARQPAPHQRDFDGRRRLPATHVGAFLSALLLGSYCIAAIVLVRVNVPAQNRRGISAALGGELEFSFYHRYFDELFLFSSIVTAAAQAAWAALREEARHRALPLEIYHTTAGEGGTPEGRLERKRRRFWAGKQVFGGSGGDGKWV